MRHSRSYFWCFALAIAASQPAAANDTFVRKAHEQFAGLAGIAARMPTLPAERAALADAADGRWNEFDLLAAALLAQDSSAATRQRAARDLERHVARLQRALATSPADRRPEVLFAYLHEHILRGKFDAQCHAVERALRTGDYNCLSGTVLYVGLAERCGMSAQAVLAPSHVYARATLAGMPFDVETTAPDWFRQSAARRAQRLTAALDGPKTPHKKRILDSVRLLAVVYYNRGVEAFGRRDFPAAAASNLIALKLDPQNAPAADNLLAAVNNWALQSARQGDPQTASLLLDRGRRVDPNRADLKATARFVTGR